VRRPLCLQQACSLSRLVLARGDPTSELANHWSPRLSTNETLPFLSWSWLLRWLLCAHMACYAVSKCFFMFDEFIQSETAAAEDIPLFSHPPSLTDIVGLAGYVSAMVVFASVRNRVPLCFVFCVLSLWRCALLT
jgi:hypothetical protein